MKLKRFAVGLLAVMMLVTASLGFVACGDEETSSNSSSESSSSSSSVSDVTSDETSTSEDETATYTVTFDYNYDGAESSVVEVTEGETVTAVTSPERDGYLFTGWYTDANCTEENEYDFDETVTADLTLYAGWEEDTGDTLTATFYLNLDDTTTVYATITFTNGGRISKSTVTSPEADGYYFDGWYADAEGTTSFNFNSKYTENQSIYAAWRTIYTFEAEYTYLTGKFGYGYSGQSSGTQMICEDNTENNTASNGYYVGWLYYNGAFLEFDFKAEEAADDVTILFRLSAEYDDLEVTGDQIYVAVNEDYDEEEDEYSGGTSYDFPISITGIDDNIGGSQTYKRDFVNFTVASQVSIQEGFNRIRLVINNNIQGTGATMKAAAPLVDCMYLYTDADLELYEYTDNIS